MFIKKTDNRGVTLMEITVALGIFILIITSVVAVFIYTWKANKIVWEQLSTQNEGRKIVQDFINELRSATYSSIGAYPLENVSTTQIIFYSNIDTDAYAERIRYSLEGTVLKKGVIKPSGVPLAYDSGSEVVTEIVHDVYNTTTPIFYYYNQNYGSTSSTPIEQPVSITEVRVVGFTLELEEDPAASPAPFQIESKTEIRNLKDS